MSGRPIRALFALSSVTSLEGEKTFNLPKDSYFPLVSPDNHYIFYNTIQGLQSELNHRTAYSYLVDTMTGEKLSLGHHALFESFFSNDSKRIISHIRQTTSPFSRVVSTELQQPFTQKFICTDKIDSSGSSIAFDVFKDTAFLLMVLNTEHSMIDFYKVSSDQKCELLNSITSQEFDESLFQTLLSVNSENVMSQFKNYFEVKISPDESGFVFGVRRKPMELKKPRALAIQKLIYVPLNGEASYVINTPLDPEGFIDDFRFLNDSRSVLFIGNQIDKEQHNIFKWDVPHVSSK